MIGSNDNTEEIVKNMINEKKISIRYMKKKNEGKHVAINRALDLAKGTLFFIVDSDDYLINDAIKRIKIYYDDIKEKTDFIGIVGLRGKNEREVWNWDGKDTGKTDFLKEKCIDATSIDYRFKYGIKGDRAEVFKLEILKKYRFPEFKGENFISEGVVWNKIANDGYRFRYFNEIIYITEYLEDGLTKNMKKKLCENLNGTIYKINEDMKYKAFPLRYRLKSCINYYRYGLYGKRSIVEMFKNCNNKFFSPIAIIIAIFMPVKEEKYDKE